MYISLAQAGTYIPWLWGFVYCPQKQRGSWTTQVAGTWLALTWDVVQERANLPLPISWWMWCSVP